MMNIQSQPQPRRLRLRVDDYYKMIELGMLEDYEKAEIIEGELIQKMTIGDKHASVVNNLTRFFVKNVSDEVLVSVQNPLRVTDYNEPEPDFVLADLTKYDGKRHPRPAEVLLVVEVSDSTLKYDRDVKLPLYAEAEIAEVWIVNLPSEIVEVHTKPKFGLYQLVQFYNRGEIVKSEMIPNLEIEVEKIIGE
ncbi:MAG: Uma2 family endonuclease [Actinomycetota bacterium]